MPQLITVIGLIHASGSNVYPNATIEMMLRMNAARRRLRSPFVIGYAPGEYGCRPPPYPPSGVTCCAGAKSPVHSSPSHQRISEGSPDGGRITARRHVHDCSRPARAASLRLMPLACISPAPRLFHPSPSSATNHRAAPPKARYWQTCPHRTAPATRDAHNATSSRRMLGFPPRPLHHPECRLSRGFCTALRVFKRV